jgi:hypothetical protein
MLYKKKVFNAACRTPKASPKNFLPLYLQGFQRHPAPACQVLARG